ncbi:MAG: hypothetical protein NC200_04555 [Candidatus Gastranaerophilales bacterium]|nr:hypothetical protein [Candidatus Gastranaerophilales bacterium]
MKKYLLGSILLLLFVAVFSIYKQLTYTHITVRFKELRPFEESIPVYYKGLIIGKATDRKHTSDYQHTLVNVVLYPKNLHLPINTKVLLKKEKKHKKEYDFLELIYPENPSDKLIANGTWLEGKATVDLETFMKNQSPDDLESIRGNLASSAENLNISLEALGQLFVILQDFVKENQPNVVGTTKNIEQATSKFNNSIREQQLSNTFTNIETSTGNLQRITDSIYDTATSVNKSVPEVNSILKSSEELINNTNTITCGVRQTLRKPFGGLRLIFGKTINENRCTPCGK